MRTWVKDLLELQTADIRTKKMNRRLKEIPNEKKEILAELDSGKEKIKAAKEKIKASELETRQIQSKIQEIQSKIDNLLSKSAMVKKNDEYKAMMNEIASQKSFISGLETKELRFYDQTDKAQTELKTAENTLKNMEIEAKETVEELSEMEASLNAEIEKALQNRKKLLSKIDPKILPLYARLIKREGEPLTKIHNYTCGFCHLKLTPQTINDAKKGQPATCDTCGHLIYFPDVE